MTHARKTFGQYFESGLTNLGDRIHQTVTDAKNQELEDLKLSIKLGFMSDEQKLQSLKRVLYDAAVSRANPEHIQNLRSAIATISNQLENERTYRNSLGYQITGIINSIILLSTLAVFFSFPATWTCNVFKNQSQACQASRIIPTKVFQFFTNPK